LIYQHFVKQNGFFQQTHIVALICTWWTCIWKALSDIFTLSLTNSHNELNITVVGSLFLQQQDEQISVQTNM